MTETHGEFLLVDDRGDRRVFDPIGNGDLVATLQQQARETPRPFNGWRELLAALGGLAVILVGGLVTLVLGSVVVGANVAIIAGVVGEVGVYLLAALVLAALVGVARHQPRPSRRESLVSLSMWRLMHECCGNCGTDLAGNSVKDDGCSVCDTCGGAWLRIERRPPPALIWSWRDRLMVRGRFRERDLSGHVNFVLPFRESRALLTMYDVEWLPRGWVLLALLAILLTTNFAFRVLARRSDLPALTTAVFITACILLAALAFRVWTARLRMRRVWLAYVASGCCPTCETQLQQGGDMQRCMNCGAVWPAV